MFLSVLTVLATACLFGCFLGLLVELLPVPPKKSDSHRLIEGKP